MDEDKEAEEKLKGAIKEIDALEKEMAELEQSLGLSPDDSLSLDKRVERIKQRRDQPN